MKEKENENQDDILRYNKLILEQNVFSRVLEPTEENIKECSEYIKQGGIVGMPTETVYGLAANAFNIDSCLKIFKYKGRPLNDPLIVHVCSLEMVKRIVIIDKEIEELLDLLTKYFWPGPLTIVLKANLDKISTKILAGKDTVGIRFPDNIIAKKLIEYSGVPIAAPSANKFCHISPVNPYHVFEDFKEFPVKILNGGVSQFCMESTVIKICSNEKKIIVFRLGAVSPDAIRKVIQGNNKYKDYYIDILSKNIKLTKKDIEKSKNDETFSLSQTSPGQFLKHYSPKLKTYLYDNEGNDFLVEIPLNNKIIFIDYKQILYNKYIGKKNIKENNFLQLSKEGEPKEAMKNFYNYLHKAENIVNMEYIIIIDLEKYMNDNSHKMTLLDRMWKAASFKKAKLID